VPRFVRIATAVIVVLAMGGAGCSSTSMESTAPSRADVRRPGPTRVVLMGDSLLAFSTTSVEVALGPQYETTNAGIGGTSLLDSNVCDGSRGRSLVERYDPDVVVVEYTGNYAQSPVTGVRPCRPVVKYGSRAFYAEWKASARRNQRELRARRARVIWVAVPKTTDPPYAKVVPGLNRIAREVAGSERNVADGWKRFGGSTYNPELHLADGLHLNAYGNDVLAAVIASAVRKH
jgi:lysophospholipase L1-like esterase